MGVAIVEHFVVNFIGKNNQAVVPSNLYDALQYRRWVQCARWVIWVDHHDAAGVSGDFGLYVFKVGHPTAGFIAQVMARGTAGQGHGGCPQRVIRHRHQHLVAII